MQRRKSRTTRGALYLPLSGFLAKFLLLHMCYLIFSNLSNANSTEVIEASSKGDLKKVEIILNASEINKQNDQGKTALHVASEFGHLDVVKYLLDNKANVNVNDVEGRRPLHLAAMNGSVAIIELLLEKNPTNVNYISSKHNWTPLHYAANLNRLEAVKILFKKGAYPYYGDKLGRKPIHLAAKNCHKDIVQHLLDLKGANVNDTSSKDQWTVLHYSIYGKCQLDFIKFLVDAKNASLELTSLDGHQAIHMAAYNDDQDVLRCLIDKKADVDARVSVFGTAYTPLHIAASNGLVKNVRTLLGNFADINLFTAEGDNALHLAAKEGHMDIAEALIEKGLKVDQYGAGWTALHHAIYANQTEMVKFLVNNHSASINIDSYHKFDSGMKPIHIAARKNHKSIIEYLVDKGVNVDETVVFANITPLHFAASEGHLESVKVLILKGANRNALDGYGEQPIHLAAIRNQLDVLRYFITDLQIDLDVVDTIEGRTPLFYAATYGIVEGVKFLLDQKANLSIADKNNQKLIHFAAKNGYENIIELLLAKNVSINDADARYGWTPLHYAAHHNQSETIKFLLDKEANPNILDSSGSHMVHMAAAGGNYRILEYMLDNKGINIDITSKKHHWTLLHFAVWHNHLDTVKFLIHNKTGRKKANTNLSDIGDEKPIHLAVRAGHLDIIKHLHSSGANLDDVSRKYNFSLLHLAATNKQYESVKYLIDEKANIDLKDYNGRKPIFLAILKGALDIVKLFLKKEVSLDEKWGNLNYTLLHYAVLCDQIEIVEYLIGKNVDVNAPDAKNEGPIQIAIRSGNAKMIQYLLSKKAKVDDDSKIEWSSLHSAIYAGRLDIIKMLVSKGADINGTDKDMERPIHIAAWEGRNDIIEYLISQNASIDVKSPKTGRTPLQKAVIRGLPVTVEYLIKKNSSINSVDALGRKSLHLAAEFNHKYIAEILIKNGASVNDTTKSSDQYMPLHIAIHYGATETAKYLIESKTSLKAVDSYGRNALHLAAYYDNKELMELLIVKEGVDVDTKIFYGGWTSLHISAHQGQLGNAVYLTEKHANLTAISDTGGSAIHYAAGSGHVEIIEYLLNKGVNINYAPQGWAPIHIAVDHNQTSTVEFLKTKGAQMNIPNADGIKPIQLAMHKKYRDLVDFFLDNCSINVNETYGSDNLTLLHLAVAQNLLDEVKNLVDRHADINAKTVSGVKPFVLAAELGFNDIIEYFENVSNKKAVVHPVKTLGVYKALDKLFEKRTPREPKFELGDSKLMLLLAAENERIETMEFIFKEKLVDVNDYEDETPLQAAASKGRLKAVQLLLSNNAEVDKRDSHNRTALHLAAFYGYPRIVDELINNNSSIHALDIWSMKPLDAILLRLSYTSTKDEGMIDFCYTFEILQRYELFDAIHDHDKTRVERCFSESIQNYNKTRAKKCFNQSIYVEIQDRQGWRPIHRAAEVGSMEVLKILIDKKVDVYSETSTGEQAIHIAAKYGMIQVIEYLYEHVDRQLQGQGLELLQRVDRDHKWTPLYYASKFEQQKVIEYLAKKGVK